MRWQDFRTDQLLSDMDCRAPWRFFCQICKATETIALVIGTLSGWSVKQETIAGEYLVLITKRISTVCPEKTRFFH